MPNLKPDSPPKLAPDAAERSRGLDPSRSFLVQAPAGSGKTYMLTQRFLRLLAQAERPDEIVAITFTNAAAAEMRHRVLEALETAESKPLPGLKIESGGTHPVDPESLEALAAAALAHSKRRNWQLLDQPSQLRIATIDAFCRSLALDSPLSWGLLSSLGGKLDPADSTEAYRRAARRTLALLEAETGSNSTCESVEALLRWRDNNWQDIETLIVQMLKNRNRWMRDFVFSRAESEQERDEDWAALRQRLEAPFQRHARQRLENLTRILDRLEGCREYALDLARFACSNGGKSIPINLAERAELPTVFPTPEDLEDAVAAYRDLANFLLTASGSTFRKRGGLNVNNGFPPTKEGKAGKERFGDFLESLAKEPGLEAALAAFQAAIPVHYDDAESELIRHCFAVLRTAALQLQLVFSETGSVDFTEIAQIALRVFAPEDGYASDFAQRQADSIRHLLIDEFQDTSRQQHELLSRLIAAWPDREGRTCFCVGDPMQSIYGFRDAEVELFERLKTHGLETYSEQDSDPFPFQFLQLKANFRTVPSLVGDLNARFEQVFGQNSDSHRDPGAVQFAPALAARESASTAISELHLAFTHAGTDHTEAPASSHPEATRAAQLQALVALIQQRLAAAQQRGEPRYRVAVLARNRKSLLPIAESLRAAAIPYRALDLVKLNERPEILDALTLARALLNPADRTAWLGVLRAPWCGLSLAELHLLASADDKTVSATPIPVLLEERLPTLESQLAPPAFRAAQRVAGTLRRAQAQRPAVNLTLGTWLASVWTALGGADTADHAQPANLRVLWTALDQLPAGELDLLGPNLASALDALYALPDPAANGEFGVQLMTIHKSKGLEFEVVLVPDLEALAGKTDHTLMSWLERGLAGESGPGDGGSGAEISEFLIAPIKTKGGESSPAKRWVDGVKKDRELLELRRLFYVAATRAREELHLFSRPRFTLGKTPGEANLAPRTGLLATAWPAYADEVEAQFGAWWKDISLRPAALETELETLAASAAPNAANLLQMPSPKPPTLVRRLPQNYSAPEFAPSTTGPSSGSGSASSELAYRRTEGGLESRLLGSAIHALLERCCRLRIALSPAAAATELVAALPATVAGLRSGGLARPAAERLAAEALAVAQQAAVDPDGAWILAPHAHAESEAQWTSLASPANSSASQPRNLRPDRVFYAARPGQDRPVWWIVDYKTAVGPQMHGQPAQQSFLEAHRAQFALQLEAYARVLRDLHPGEPIEIGVGIFYPRLPLLDQWAL